MGLSAVAAWAVAAATVAWGQGSAAAVDGPTLLAGPEVGPALVQAASRLLGPYDAERGGGPGLLVALGRADNEDARRLLPAGEVEGLPSPDAFVVRSGQDANGVPIFVCAGRTPRATGYAFFELLQRLGFGFLHPLKPVLPEMLSQPLPLLNITEAPRWEFRGTHYHTQHPLELTNFLNGYDSDRRHETRSSWAAGFPAWEAFLHWMLAQKQNYVEWVVLADHVATEPQPSRGGGFEVSDERRERFRLINEAAHGLGLEVGADVPITLRQQHSLNLLPEELSGDMQRNEEVVRGRVRWLIDCGFDHLGTELGTTEFTRGLAAKDMVHMLNVTKEVLGPKRRLLVKNHCSSSQKADGFHDPRPSSSGAPLNYNYLGYFADPNIVAMPHTVQIYSLRDPAPTYGNTNFSDLGDWTRFLLKEGRPVVYYPETAYWVNYDISVPLFLAPSYIRSRVDDANDLDAMGGVRPVLGQLNFESGWQWGYWLANSAQAAVAWQKTETTQPIYERLLRFLPTGIRTSLVTLLEDSAEAQRRLLIYGLREGQERPLPPAPGPIGAGAVTGIAYLQGTEGLSDFSGLASRHVGAGAPQPDRLRFIDFWPGLHSTTLRIFQAATGEATDIADALAGGQGIAGLRRTWYHDHLRPLLAEMNTTFGGIAARFKALPAAPASAAETVEDLKISAHLLALRCAQVLALYDHAADCGDRAGSVPKGSEEWCSSRLATAKGALEAALALVPERESRYGLSDYGLGGADGHSLITGWRPAVPTAYPYGYLWAVHKLFYWQRDQDIVERRIHNPCYGTINDPVELGFYGGGSRSLHRTRDALRASLDNRLLHMDLAECLGNPDQEPMTPGAPPDTAGCSGVGYLRGLAGQDSGTGCGPTEAPPLLQPDQVVM